MLCRCWTSWSATVCWRASGSAARASPTGYHSRSSGTPGFFADPDPYFKNPDPSVFCFYFNLNIFLLTLLGFREFFYPGPDFSGSDQDLIRIRTKGPGSETQSIKRSGTCWYGTESEVGARLLFISISSAIRNKLIPINYCCEATPGLPPYFGSSGFG